MAHSSRWRDAKNGKVTNAWLFSVVVSSCCLPFGHLGACPFLCQSANHRSPGSAVFKPTTCIVLSSSGTGFQKAEYAVAKFRDHRLALGLEGAFSSSPAGCSANDDFLWGDFRAQFESWGDLKICSARPPRQRTTRHLPNPCVAIASITVPQT